MKRAIFGIFLTLLAGSVLGCATSGDLAKVCDQQNQIAAKADQALQEAQSAKATAEAAKMQADAANAAATRAETTARAATTTNNSATGGPIEENPGMNSAPGGQTQEAPVNQTPQDSGVFRRSMGK
jgi:murein lipoprotein